MTEKPITTKSELLAAIDENWINLKAVLDHLTEAQLTTIRDAAGWSAKDHVIHLTRWERSVVTFLQHQPRHLGLGVDEMLYLHASEDEVNAAIFEKTRGLALVDALRQFRENHQELLELLKPLSEADLHKHYRDFLPDEPGEGDGPLAIDFIVGDTSGHYASHQEWIEVLVNKQG
jgi:hypothetical protein